MSNDDLEKEKAMNPGGHMRIYLAGPITGMPDDNAPLFEAMTTLFTLRGYHVCNPHVLCKDIPKSAEHEVFMRRCLSEILGGGYDVLYALKGWQKSGAYAEIVLAMSLGMWVMAEANEHETIYQFQHEMVRNYPSRRTELVPTYSENVNKVLGRLDKLTIVLNDKPNSPLRQHLYQALRGGKRLVLNNKKASQNADVALMWCQCGCEKIEKWIDGQLLHHCLWSDIDTDMDWIIIDYTPSHPPNILCRCHECSGKE